MLLVKSDDSISVVFQKQELEDLKYVEDDEIISEINISDLFCDRYLSLVECKHAIYLLDLKSKEIYAYSHDKPGIHSDIRYRGYCRFDIARNIEVGALYGKEERKTG